MPMPATTIGTTTVPYSVCASTTEAMTRIAPAWRASPVMSTGFTPNRCTMNPLSGATTMGASVHGAARRPASSAP